MARDMADQECAQPILHVRDLSVCVSRAGTSVSLVENVNLTLTPGRTLALVGESGCGKTLTALALLDLVEKPAVASGSVCYRDREILGAPAGVLCTLRGDRIAMIFQEPMSAMNPLMRVGDQVAEPLWVHRHLSRREAREQVLALFAEVGIAEPELRYDAFPHELSGGLRQRALIAMALACAPDVLIADEPTTALDVTLQCQILALLGRLLRQRGMAMLFVTHDLTLVATIADEVAVMYAGTVVELAPRENLLVCPRHPYTRGLWQASPSWPGDDGRLRAIPGAAPEPSSRPAGCAFASRCERALPRCRLERPRLEDGVACFLPYVEPLSYPKTEGCVSGEGP
jgi:peptide/nickel transport system ATP-binding protein